jgi:hypothetical protein
LSEKKFHGTPRDRCIHVRAGAIHSRKILFHADGKWERWCQGLGIHTIKKMIFLTQKKNLLSIM